MSSFVLDGRTRAFEAPFELSALEDEAAIKELNLELKERPLDEESSSPCVRFRGRFRP
jgi:hypothetical protein